MLFNSYIFIFLFLPVTLLGYFTLGRFHLVKAARIWLLVTSLFFYGYWNPPYLLLMVISIVFNHQMGNAIASAKLNSDKAKVLLWTGIAINLASICYYKYANFFLSSVNAVFQSNITLNEIFLPLAISFYTFTQIAYLVDAYRGETQENKYDLITYSLFVVFFPQLIAGPILRHDELIPQLGKLKNYIFSHKNFAYGITLFSLGLSKKVLIADNISPWVSLAFNNADNLSFIEAWVGGLSYTFQLYFDFSGYSDMAIGLGWMFNIKLPINFDSPYKATSISDFWRRWHITLSNFLRDYLYIPLGGSRQGEFRRYTNLIVTMLLGGLWHGAGWTFVLWGGIHGTYLSINHWWRKQKTPLPKLLAWVITFLAVIYGWVLFRAATLDDGLEIIKTMTGFNGIILPGEPRGRLAIITNLGIGLKRWSELDYLPVLNGSKSLAILALLGLVAWVKVLPNTQEVMQKMQPTWWWAITVGFMASICLLSLNRVSEFLYFQF
ncbi:MAG: MBOAT family protein [Xenococcaceae cyanobacterium MO_167.B27]|nr:MBOAT family protein [Xenococcaceae cyanobacterium MO_167.B27]